eukprot:scaffold177_cov334-Pavlova_lutheri.AAC.73
MARWSGQAIATTCDGSDREPLCCEKTEEGGMSLRKPAFVGQKVRSVSRGANATRAPVSVRASADRPLWLPGSNPPDHLDGSLVGDYGFDPLKLGSDPWTLYWMQQAELQNARWAMLGVVGILVPELMTKAGILDAPMWTEAGSQEYFASPVALTIVQFYLFAWVEGRRWQDILKPGSVSEDPIFKGRGFVCTGKDVGYPGGKWFDPLGMATPDQEAKLRLKEIKNGRLAMLAFLGFLVQANVTGKGPVDNLLDHLSNPGKVTFFSNIGW